jgi:hypothetical protein
MAAIFRPDLKQANANRPAQEALRALRLEAHEGEHRHHGEHDDQGDKKTSHVLYLGRRGAGASGLYGN